MAEDRRQFPFRVSQELYEKFSQEAERRNVSKNTFLKMALMKFLTQHEGLTEHDINQIEAAMDRVLKSHLENDQGDAEK